MANMKAEHRIVRNAWMKSGFKWFDKNEGVVEDVGGRWGPFSYYYHYFMFR